jgi:hypothetical protein
MWMLLNKSCITREQKLGRYKKSAICAHYNTDRLLDGLITKDYEGIANEELQHPFTINFRVLWRRITVVSNKYLTNCEGIRTFQHKDISVFRLFCKMMFRHQNCLAPH